MNTIEWLSDGIIQKLPTSMCPLPQQRQTTCPHGIKPWMNCEECCKTSHYGFHIKCVVALCVMLCSACVYIIPDYAHRPRGMHKKVGPIYRTWTEPMWNGEAKKDGYGKYSCPTILFMQAWNVEATGVVIDINDKEQLQLEKPGHSWTLSAPMAVGRHKFVITFQPMKHSEEVHLNCYMPTREGG